jgi:hypothetical protein
MVATNQKLVPTRALSAKKTRRNSDAPKISIWTLNGGVLAHNTRAPVVGFLSRPRTVGSLIRAQFMVLQLGDMERASPPPSVLTVAMLSNGYAGSVAVAAANQGHASPWRPS